MSPGKNAKLVAFDLDGTLLKEESVLEFLKLQKNYAKKLELSKKITSCFKENIIDAAAEMNMITCMLSGLKIKKCKECITRLKLFKGADYVAKTLKEEGYILAILSDGFSIVSDFVKQKLNFDYAFANELEIKEGILTGKLIAPYFQKMPYSGCINHNMCKRKVLSDLCRQLEIELSDVIAVGNGCSDICFLEISGKSIGFNPNNVIKKKADVVVESDDLKDILPYIIGEKI